MKLVTDVFVGGIKKNLKTVLEIVVVLNNTLKYEMNVFLVTKIIIIRKIV